MEIAQMKFQQLRYFYEACRLNSITRAAEYLHVSQPSISMAIRDLESEYSLMLIKRKYRGFVLTGEGEKVYRYVASFLLHADSLEDAIRSLDVPFLPIRIATPPMISALLLPLLMQKMRSEHPDFFFVTKEYGSQECLRLIDADVFDLAAVTSYDPISSQIGSEKIGTIDVLWCANPKHPMAAKNTVSIMDLENEPMVLFDENYILNQVIRRQFDIHHIMPNIIYTTEQVSTSIYMARQGVGSCFLFDFIANMSNGIIVKPMEPPITLDFYVIWKKGAVSPGKVKIFTDLCRESYAKYKSEAIAKIDRA